MQKTGNRLTEGDTCVGGQCSVMCQTVDMSVQCVVASTATDGGSNKLPFSGESASHAAMDRSDSFRFSTLIHLCAPPSVRVAACGAVRYGTRFDSRTGHNSPDGTPPAGGKVERRVLSLV